MRLTPQQARIIQALATECFGRGTQVLLFGSRSDDRLKGGDIDLLVRPGGVLGAEETLARKIRLLAKLDRALGERKVDLVVEVPDDTRPIVRIARETGIGL